jgi:hypothetical protein
MLKKEEYIFAENFGEKVGVFCSIGFNCFITLATGGFVIEVSMPKLPAAAGEGAAVLCTYVPVPDDVPYDYNRTMFISELAAKLARCLSYQ